MAARIIRVVCKTAFGVGLSVLGCGTDAVGVSECREIENARCEAAVYCEEDGEPLVKDVEACQRFSKGHCLHGMIIDNAPRATENAACVTVIERAGRCAASTNASKRTAAGCDIDLAASETKSSSKVSVCDLILNPERASKCAFLAEEPEDKDDEEEEEADAGDGGNE